MSIQKQSKKEAAKQDTFWSCESCTFYEFDEEYEEYICDVNMDEDELARFYSDPHYRCPFYQSNDEYRIVRHQM